MVQILKIGILRNLSRTLDHILESQKQVGNRRTLFKAVTIIGVFGAVTQHTHELRHTDIGGAGESGNTVIVIQGTIVQRLRMGCFGPEEQLIPLPFMHIADHRGGVFLASGIVDDTGAGESDTEVYQIQRGFQHHHQCKKAAALPQPTCLLPAPYTQRIRVCIRGQLAEKLRIDQQKEIQERKGTVVGKEHGIGSGIRT